WKIITKDKEADICVLNMPILDTRREKSLLGTFIADLVLALMSFMAESERQNIRERQAAGIAAAKARGVRFGRRPKPLPENFCEVCGKVKEGRLSIMEGAKACEMPYSTFRDKIREYGETSVS
ncbi:MAG: recombinase family protein, partial [Lachnospiraceae bacterium]|nr:recombinase family protein [Lachnospiraceae bacterium]